MRVLLFGFLVKLLTGIWRIAAGIASLRSSLALSGNFLPPNQRRSLVFNSP